MTFYFVVDSEGEDRQVYAANTPADARWHAGWLIEGWERVDLDEWTKVADLSLACQPTGEQIADWVAPLSVDVYRPIYASGTVTLGDYGLDDWFAADADLSAAQVSELVNRFQDRVKEIIGERLIDPEVTRSSDPSAETSGPDWLTSIIQEVENESHEWVAGEDA